MGRHIKKELLKTIDLMIEANLTIRDMNQNDRSVIMDNLAQSQEAALRIGNALESLEGKGSQTVFRLEEYCESLYLMSQSVEDPAQYVKCSKIIQKQLACIREEIYHGLSDEKWEIVFLPYKASMWDSLESVWRAASLDKQCDVYVVPIPYFERRSDGTLGEMRDEGDLYPRYVPITSWKEYNMMERHPDIIYIHNPYDQYNYATSVHPNFYSVQLKRYTNMLVYIPYFVATAHRVGEDFCTLPGVFFADKVIVEDDDIRKIYIDELRKFEKENGCEGKFGKAEKKFLSLGSPKFDKVLYTKREQVSIPSEWEPFLYAEDGTRKKVVLYNTTLDALLKDEGYIKKIKAVLHMFYENKDDITLLWRPHPLNMAAMQSVRPQKLMEYQTIVKDYKEEGYGIYDDTPDIHRAIAISDIYYGDWSSVVSLYEKTGKPIYIQAAGDCLGKSSYVYFSSMFLHEGNVYGFACQKNMLMKIDFKGQGTHYFMKLNNESEDNRELYFASIACRDKLFMIPASDPNMMVYDFASERYEKIQLCSGNPGQRGFFFMDVREYGNYLYLIPFHYGYIVRYDLDTKKLKSIPLFKKTDDTSSLQFGFAESVDEDRIAIPAGKAVILFDLASETWEKYPVSEENGETFNIERIFYYKQHLWLLPTDALVLLKWDYLNGTIEQYADFPPGCRETDNNFGGKLAHRIDNYLYCFPANTNMAVKVNLDNGEITELTSLRPFCQSDGSLEGQRVFANLVAVEKKILLQHRENQMVVYDTQEDTVYAFSSGMANTLGERRKMYKDFMDKIFRPGTKPIITDGESAGEKIHKQMKMEAG